ncbi:MAG: zinc-binding dehydrogenase [Lachnospiraceae bacterium]
MDIAEERMEMARKVGADEVLKGDDDVVEKIMGLTNGKGVEVAVDCSGSSIGRVRCLESLQECGRMLFI